MTRRIVAALLVGWLLVAGAATAGASYRCDLIVRPDCCCPASSAAGARPADCCEIRRHEGQPATVALAPPQDGEHVAVAPPGRAAPPPAPRPAPPLAIPARGLGPPIRLLTQSFLI